MVQPEAVGAFENTSANEYKFRQTRGRECPGGMGLLTAGFNSGSESPTDPTAPLARQ